MNYKFKKKRMFIFLRVHCSNYSHLWNLPRLHPSLSYTNPFLNKTLTFQRLRRSCKKPPCTHTCIMANNKDLFETVNTVWFSAIWQWALETVCIVWFLFVERLRLIPLVDILLRERIPTSTTRALYLFSSLRFSLLFFFSLRQFTLLSNYESVFELQKTPMGTSTAISNSEWMEPKS